MQLNSKEPQKALNVSHSGGRGREPHNFCNTFKMLHAI